ncbi:DUF3558 domain-containing protein [Gordonia alkaliphila]|uniref:DUF3558 family protein n=1 Tax=Gordonia alkaliphila TaxID=1053547 RepID=UPI001FF69141|nr:DUF3558 family protein [Gordonia alkaliphila]MCK0439856.1 DUF3558 domain-containing protein [Gordonia alkaliphila]
MSSCGSGEEQGDISAFRRPPIITAPSSPSVALPFSSTFTDRWNEANNGSQYEPCTALVPSELGSVGVDSGSVRDAAGTNGQTLRGCTWDYRATADGQRWAVSQTVANSSGLAAYKEKYSMDHWMEDLTVYGRVVGVTDSPDLGECMTYVQSGQAGITTLVIHHRPPHPPVSEVCDRAIAFTKATIDKMPP